MPIIRFLFRFLLGLLILLVIIGVFLPNNATVKRSTVISATPQKIFPLLNSMKAFHTWSPWAELDPNTVYSFDGPETGIGAQMTWRSQVASVGEGSQTIIQSRNNHMVKTALVFGENSTGTATFKLEPQTNTSTRVVWQFNTVFGWDLFGRYFGLMMDNMIGASYEKGLRNLRKKIEGQ